MAEASGLGFTYHRVQEEDTELLNIQWQMDDESDMGIICIPFAVLAGRTEEEARDYILGELKSIIKAKKETLPTFVFEGSASLD
jgi:hypothetical protein